MKKLVFVALGAVLMASCAGEQPKGMTENEYNVKVDSLVGEKMNDLFMQAMEDRDRRISIEVKPKADSIVAAWKAADGQ